MIVLEILIFLFFYHKYQLNRLHEFSEYFKKDMKENGYSGVDVHSSFENIKYFQISQDYSKMIVRK